MRKAFFTGLVCLAVAPSLYAQTKEYRDRRFGVSVSLPVGWKWTGPKRWGDQESTTIFKEPRTHPELKLYVKLLRTPENLSPEEMEKKLLSEAEYKVGQRRHEGLKDYRLRERTYQRSLVRGLPALSWACELTHRGENMVEYLTRIRNVKSNALFFAFLPAGELEDFKKRVDPVIDRSEIP